MRHVSRTHKVALDCCLIGLIWIPKIHIRYTDTKHQLADVLTDREFHTWWLEQSSSYVQYQPFQLHKLLHYGGEDSRAKRRKSCVRVVTCSYESTFFHSDKFLHRIKSDASTSLEMPVASVKPDGGMSIESKLIRSSVDLSSATFRSILWRVDEMAAEKPVASRRRRFRRLRQFRGWDLVL